MWMFRKKDFKANHLFDVGFHEDPNVAHRRAMEDKHAIVMPFLGDSNGYFGLFDGHGGVEIAELASNKMHEVLQDEIRAQETNGLKMKECFENTYAKMDELLKGVADEHGATAVTCLLKTEGQATHLYIANAGDARAVLCRNGKAIRLTQDHKPSELSEKQRLEDCGGFIMRNRVCGVLAVSRALGDHVLKKFVTSEPYFNEETLTTEDQVLIIACDGVWDVLQDQEAVDQVLNEKQAQKMSEVLVKEAMRRGTTDNVSAIVIRFCW